MTSKKTYRIVHTLQTITGIIFGIAMFFLVGTCGSLECDTISLGQALIQLAIGALVAMTFGYAFSRLTKIEESLHKNDAIVQARIENRERRRQEYWNAYFCS